MQPIPGKSILSSTIITIQLMPKACTKLLFLGKNGLKKGFWQPNVQTFLEWFWIFFGLEIGIETIFLVMKFSATLIALLAGG